jgi:Uma2 family endonuclease
MECTLFNQPSALREPLTLAEWNALPESDEWLEELVDGHVVREPLPAVYHGAIQFNVGFALMEYARRTGSGYVFGHAGVKLADEPRLTIRGPDVAFVRRERVPGDEMRLQALPFAPDVAVEVVSPSNSAAELQEIVVRYLASGSSSVWVFYPSTRQVLVYSGANSVRLLSEKDELTDNVLPWFSEKVETFFEI